MCQAALHVAHKSSFDSADDLFQIIRLGQLARALQRDPEQ